jgi:hypothetical protein
MLLTKELEIRIVGNVYHYYKNNNIPVLYNQINKLPIELVNPESHLIVDAKCDVCGKEVKIQLRRYNKSFNNGGYYTCSTKCNKDKREKKLIEIFGTKNPYKSDLFKQKSKETFFKKWGTEHFRQSELWKKTNGLKEIEKRKKTIFEDFKYKNPNVLGQDDENFIIKCDLHGECKIPKGVFSNRKIVGTEICTICKPIESNVSGKEILVSKFIKEIYKGEIVNSFKIGRKEIDIFLPELKIGFEFNGLRWHSEYFLDKNYHIDKTLLCKKHDIRLVHIFEDDFDNRFDIVKSIISNLLGESKKIHARKTRIERIEDNKMVKKFLTENHLQGFVNTNINYGLFVNNELFSLMTFMKTRKILDKNRGEDEYELVRFCNKIGFSVVGGASKLFKQFIKEIKPKKIISYCDISWANGNLYKNLGFELVGLTEPNYHYIVNGERENRIKYQKHKLVKKGFSKDLTESQIMGQQGYYRIYNCGNEKYLYVIKN